MGGRPIRQREREKERIRTRGARKPERPELTRISVCPGLRKCSQSRFQQKIQGTTEFDENNLKLVK